MKKSDHYSKTQLKISFKRRLASSQSGLVGKDVEAIQEL